MLLITAVYPLFLSPSRSTFGATPDREPKHVGSQNATTTTSSLGPTTLRWEIFFFHQQITHRPADS
jgi:hypothetical protein